nr:dihydrolipoyllysine-residue succinyltransferase component of 2-oxoglutarate dehydrogenase complex 2, mitochondrial-like [Tanacetum cinerariifolium]
MLGVFRRRVVTETSILGKSWRATRPVASTTTTCFASEGEALLPRGIIGNARGICHVAQPGGAVNVRPLREVMTGLQPCVSMQMQSRMFSSDSELLHYM